MLDTPKAGQNIHHTTKHIFNKAIIKHLLNVFTFKDISIITTLLSIYRIASFRRKNTYFLEKIILESESKLISIVDGVVSETKFVNNVVKVKPNSGYQINVRNKLLKRFKRISSNELKLRIKFNQLKACKSLIHLLIYTTLLKQLYNSRKS